MNSMTKHDSTKKEKKDASSKEISPHEKNDAKKKVEVRVAGPNYQEKDPMQAIMEQIDQYDKGTPKRKHESMHNHAHDDHGDYS